MITRSDIQTSSRVLLYATVAYYGEGDEMQVRVIKMLKLLFKYNSLLVSLLRLTLSLTLNVQ